MERRIKLINNSELEIKNNAVNHKNNSLNRLDLSFLKHIELKEYKQSDLLAYWINDFSEYHDEEKHYEHRLLHRIREIGYRKTKTRNGQYE